MHLGKAWVLKGCLHKLSSYNNDLHFNIFNWLFQVKQVIQFMIYVEYNWRLERSFLMDEFALPPALPEETSLVLSDHKYENSEDDLFKEDSADTTSDECLVLPRSKGTPKNSRASQSNSIDKPSDKRRKRNDGGDDSLNKSELLKMSERLSIEEHSDPLRSGHLLESKASKSRKKSRMEVAPLPLANRFRKALNDIALSCSSNIKFSVPFLESEAGRLCELRKFFPAEIYWSSQFYKDSSSHQGKLVMEPETLGIHFGGKRSNRLPDNIEIQPWHPFIHAKLTSSVNEPSIQSLLASFRAHGGQIKGLCPHEVAKKKVKTEETNIPHSRISASASGPPKSKICWEKRVRA